MKRNPLSIIWTYLWGNICFTILYEKKYRSSKYFSGRFKGLNARGWKWVLDDAAGRVWMRTNRGIKFPVSPFNTVINYKNIVFDPDDLHIFMGKGRYFQAENAKIIIGKGTFIANNSGFITANHDMTDLTHHVEAKDIILGEKCWVGLNCVILPGVVLGDQTIVAAGAVVTKSFPEGHCVIGGVPAKIIKRLNADDKTQDLMSSQME